MAISLKLMGISGYSSDALKSQEWHPRLARVKTPQVAEVKQQAEETPWEISWLIYG